MESNRDRRVNHCKWCGAPTEMEAMLLPETPILEFVENKIDKLGRNRVWGENSNWAVLDMDPDDEAELLVYDEMLNKVSLKHVCTKCIEDDDKLWAKYYGKGGELDISFEPDFK